MLEFFCNIVCWTPWVSFFSECALIQLGVLMSFFYFNQARTLFYALIYMLLVFIWLGVFLSYYNIELFTGFLWVVELTVVFIIILFLFFFNFSSELRCSTFFFYKAAALLLFFFFFDEYTIHVSLLNFNFFFDDFYEARSSALMNDIHALFLSYYIFNSFLFFLLGLLIFFTSIICVCTLKAARNTCAEAVVNSLLIYNFFSDLLSFEFLRKQNLVFQNLRKPATRLIKKTSQEWFKKSQD